MRKLPLVLAALIAFPTFAYAQGAVAERDKTFLELQADAEKKKVMKQGITHLSKIFKADVDLAKPKARNQSKIRAKQDQEREAFRLWLSGTEETLGVDLTKMPLTVLELFDEARLKASLVKYKPNRIDYVRVPAPRGMKRHEYAVFTPKTYKPKTGRYPLVISMHERVIDAKHPAFRGDAKKFLERSRQVIFDNWQKSPAGQSTVVIAPTGLSDGFLFRDEGHFDNLQALYRTLATGMTDYRIDWDKVFVEIYGPAIRVACEQPFMFAGFILRDRVENRRRPFLSESEFFMLENLNGTPLCYIADQAHWDKVGKPLADALTAAYKKAGAPNNLIILKAQRDANGALQPDPAVIQKFITTHRRPQVRKQFKWRFFRPTMSSCLPLVLGPMNFAYGDSQAIKAAALEQKAGAVNFEVKLDEEEITVKDKDGKETKQKRAVNRIVINVTEAEGCQLLLPEGLIKWDLPITIVVNGEELKKGVRLQRDWNFFWNVTVPRRYFMMPYFGIIELDFKHVPQFIDPAEKKAAEEAEKKAAEEAAKKDAEKGK